MGQVPAGFRFPDTLDKYKVPHGAEGSRQLPNGTDFWWDEFLTNRWNCWFGNTGPDGTPVVSGPGNAGQVPGLPPNALPDCAGGTNRDLSTGTGDVAKEAYLLECANGPDEDTGPLDCDWWTPPARPGGSAADARRRQVAAAQQRFAATDEAKALHRRMERLAAGQGG
jgi:hypothetical protein